MTKCLILITTFLILLVGHSIHVSAQDYIWQPGGKHVNLESFQEDVDYRGEDFRNSNFWNMNNIRGINLDKTNFEGSRFGEMYVTDTTFRGANLRLVDGHALKGEMTGCDLTDADISGSDLPINASQLRSTKNYQDKSLANCTIWGTDLSGTSFVGFDLTNTRLIGCNLKDCDFTDADITKIKATGVTLNQIKATKNYRNKDLGETVFMQCNFDNADFRGFKLSVFHECSLINANLSDSVFIKVHFHDGRYYLHSFSTVMIHEYFGFSNCQLTREQFESIKNYQENDLSQILLLRMNLDHWDFRNCNMKDAQLEFSSMTDADFTNANIQGANFSNTNVTRKQWQSTQTFHGMEKFMPPTTDGVDLSGYDFSGMNICAFFHGVSLKNTNFSNAILNNVNFLHCDLAGADFTEARLTQVLFSEGSPLTWEQFLATQNGKTRNFSEITLAYVPVNGWDFSNVDMTTKRWFACDFPNCNFDNATINFEFFSTSLVKKQCKDAADFYQKNGLTREQFESTANYRSKVLKKASFSGCDLAEMSFVGFDLTDASFEETNLLNVDFDDATINGCVFTYSARIKNIPLTQEQLYSTATWKSGIIENVSFKEMDLSGWDFSGKKLMNCNFVNCIFGDTNFSDTQMKGVNFSCWLYPEDKFDHKLTVQQIKQTWNFKNQQMWLIIFKGYFEKDLKATSQNHL